MSFNTLEGLITVVVAYVNDLETCLKNSHVWKLLSQALPLNGMLALMNTYFNIYTCSKDIT